MSGSRWYLNRLRAMAPLEILLHVRKRLRQRTDRSEPPAFAARELAPVAGSYPVLPSAFEAPENLCAALRVEAESILAGHWHAFGHLALQVENPPRWNEDPLARVDLATSRFAFDLNHRLLPSGADIKLVWEWSRWSQLVRLAQAAFLWGDSKSGKTVLEWLSDWVLHNPANRGWQWTSSLEAGIRLVQFAWIDALLGGAATNGGVPDDWQDQLNRLRRAILPMHARFVWRYLSFGSSANNHLLGELAGLILAVARWPALADCAAPVEVLQRRWEQQVLVQFTVDGGNREQALHYQLFSLEFCLQTMQALVAAERPVRSQVAERLERARLFFAKVHTPVEPWDYGDSDDAWVTPMWRQEARAADEWHAWAAGLPEGTVVAYWLRDQSWNHSSSRPVANPGFVRAGEWRVYAESGLALREEDQWRLRWDLSPLGYLATAAHGHLDALHLSLWHGGHAVVIDPGTGAYYADAALRQYLASWEAHNGPHAEGIDDPTRLGPFLWGKPHRRPNWREPASGVLSASLRVGRFVNCRTIARVPDGAGWVVRDQVKTGSRGSQSGTFRVYWQFAPGWWIQKTQEREFTLQKSSHRIAIRLSDEWSAVEPILAEDGFAHGYAGMVSPRFRVTERAPGLRLTGVVGVECATVFVSV